MANIELRVTGPYKVASAGKFNDRYYIVRRLFYVKEDAIKVAERLNRPRMKRKK